LATNNQKNSCETISNFELLILNFCKKGKPNKITRDKPIQATPPNFEGIDRKIA
jgi:hypothetical protein